MHRYKSVAVAMIATCMLGMAAAASAQDIDTTGGAPLSDFWSPFGSPDTATYGQTFTADSSQDQLQSFSLFLGARSAGSGALSLEGYFGTWEGDHLGTLLYSSSLQTTNGNQEFDFDAGGLSLTAGSQYVAFLSVSGLGTQPESNFFMPIANESLAGGDFVFLNNGTDFSQLFSSGGWAVTDTDVAFKATFGAAAPAVPEPSTWAMMLIGFAFVGGAARSAKRRSKLALS